jgi:hypothetical protein
MKKRTVAFLLMAFLFSPITVSGFALDTSCWVGNTGEIVNETNNIPGEPADQTNSIPGEAFTTNTFITLYALNLRPSPSTNLHRIAVAPAGSYVQVTDFRDGEWYAVTFNGMCGYMFAQYLKPVDVTPPNPPADLSNLAPVEIIDWFTADTLIPLRVPFTIIDARTGISWQVARGGGDLHADVETVTAHDTAEMLRAFNHTWSWEPRPVWVVINGRTLAASINGMPHGFVTNHNNNVNGHFCLHFFGSWAHGATSVDMRHHNAVLEAFFTAIVL